MTDEEALAVGNAIADAIMSGDAESYCAEFDWDAFGRLILHGLPNDTPEAEIYRETILKDVRNGGMTLAHRLISQVAGGGSAEVLRARETPTGKCVLVRFLSADDGLNYHEYYVARRSIGVRVVDSYDYLSALRQSEAIQQIGIAMLPHKADLIPSRRDTSMRQIREHTEHITGMLEGMQQGEPQKVLDHYKAVNPAVQRQKRAMLMRIMALQQLDDEQYRAAIDEYRLQYPDDPSVDMVCLYDYIERGWFEEAHANIDRVDRVIGGDSFLQLLHALAFIREGKLDDAKRILRRTIGSDHLNRKAHWLLVRASLEEKDHQTTAKLLTKIRDELGDEPADLTQVPEYAEFVKSEAYQEWVKTSAKR